MKVSDRIKCIKNLSYAGGDLLHKDKYYLVYIRYITNEEPVFYVKDETDVNLFLTGDILDYFEDQRKTELNRKLKKIKKA